ncbi:hypothetical protein GCM10020001_095400 [Nonomuraea salmonea]
MVAGWPDARLAGQLGCHLPVPELRKPQAGGDVAGHVGLPLRRSPAEQGEEAPALGAFAARPLVLARRLIPVGLQFGFEQPGRHFRGLAQATGAGQEQGCRRTAQAGRARHVTR